jgi:hypothetical protein
MSTGCDEDVLPSERPRLSKESHGGEMRDSKNREGLKRESSSASLHISMPRLNVCRQREDCADCADCAEWDVIEIRRWRCLSRDCRNSQSN